jgi:fused signal recognition particle receptor
MALFKDALSKVRKGLTRTRDALSGGVGGLRNFLAGRKVDDALLTELETRLIQADVGVTAAARLVADLRAEWNAGRIDTGEDATERLKLQLTDLWPEQDRSITFATSGPTVILVAGVNGAGKTTSIAKLAALLTSQGKSVLLAACDTYRAGAVRQLEIWSERIGVQIVKGAQGGDPAAVAFDACEAAIARDVDVLIIDTAGRLHTQDPLMRQLTKIRDITTRKIDGAPHEVILVLDATTGQNAVQQALKFTDAIDVSGLFLTKLDGTTKGGVVVAVHDQTSIPVKFIGVGETPDDVEPFDPAVFVEALLGSEDG